MTTNCTISVANFGKLHVRAETVVHGMSIVAYSAEGTARRSKAFYPSKRTSGSFDLGLVFSKYSTYKTVCDWLERYSRWATDPNTDASAVRVLIPSRKFDKTAVLKSGVTFGERVGTIAYRVNLAFVGSRDPIELDSPVLSRYEAPKNTSDKALPYFYPAGSQLKGTNRGFDLLYDRHGGNDQALDQAIIQEVRRRTGGSMN